MGIIHNSFFSRAVAITAFFLILSAQLFAQPSITLLRTSSEAKSGTALSANSSYLSVDHQALASLFENPNVTLRSIPLPKMSGFPESVDLELTEFTVIGEHTKVFYVENGKEIPRGLPTVRTYRGKVKGNPNTLAFIAAEPNGNVSGFIRFDGKENFSIGPANRYDTYTSVITPMSTVASDLSQCNMGDAAQYTPNGIHPMAKSSMKIQSQPLAAAKTCVVAIDEDFACYSEFGDYTDYITARLAAITTVYESEIGVAMTLGPMHVFTSADPYSGSNSDALLRSFTNYWVANHQGDADQRTLAHLVSRRLGGGGAQGIAWVEGMCHPESIGYALTNISGTMTGVDEAVMAHELGHNVGSQHTHDCAAYPPSGIDHCSPAEGGCSWTVVQQKGCIMSYCNNKVFSFLDPVNGDHRVIDVLQAAVDAATCLATLAKITVNTTAVNFPKTPFQTTKDSTLKAVVTNNGTDADLKIIGASIGGRDASEFAVKNPPKFPVILKYGESLTLTVTFKPSYGGDDSAQLVIGHNAAGGSSYIQLSGRGAIPIATYLHDAINDPNYILDFGIVQDHTPVDSVLNYVRNDGDAPLKITRTWFSSDAAEFSILSGGAPAFVAPGAIGTMVVRFTAKSNGSKSNVYLDFKSNDPSFDTSYTSSLQVQAEVKNLAVAPSGMNDPQLFISPNPFKRKLKIELRAGSEYLGKTVSVNIFDNLGRKVGVIDGSKLNASTEELSWQPDATLSEGTYTVVAKIGEQEIVKQIVYIK